MPSTFKGTGPVNAAFIVFFSLMDCIEGLDISSVASGGTSTLTIEVSTDLGQTYQQIDSIAAALAINKHYGRDTVGAGTTPLAPLSFPWIRITAGAAGATFTVTLTVSAK